MRIVDVCGFYSPAGGGVRSYVDQKFAACAAHGHDLTVVAPGETAGVEPRPGGRVVWTPGPSMPFDRNYRRFGDPAEVFRVLDDLHPDVVEGASPWRSGWIAAHWPGCAARSLVFHQDLVAAWPQTLLRGIASPGVVDALCRPYWSHLQAVSRRFDVTVTSGEWLARRLQGFGVCNATAVPFGVEPARFGPHHRSAALRADLLARCGLPPTAALALCVSRMHPEKQHRTVIAGVVAARRGGPVGLVLAGDGPFRRSVERIAWRAGAVHLLGSVGGRAEMARLYASADVLVHGSAAETYGLAVAEAQASGLKVVAPDRGGAADLVGRNGGWLYPAGDASGLARALRRAVAAAEPARPATVSTSDDHFAGLFDLYAGLVRRQARLAAEQGAAAYSWSRRRSCAAASAFSQSEKARVLAEGGRFLGSTM